MDYPRMYNAVSDFIDRHVEDGRGDHVAFIDPDRSLTYKELQDATEKTANMLRRHGFEQEDRIALLMLDSINFPIVFWGAIRAGVVPVALNTLLTTEQYGYILGDSRVKGVFISTELMESAGPAIAAMNTTPKVFRVGGGAVAGQIDAGVEFDKCQTGFPPANTTRDDVAFWLYSSGSTGMPKGVMHVHTSLMETARLYGQGVLGIQPDDVCFSAAKLFFAYGLGNGMSFPMSVGATTVLLPGRPTPQAVFDVLKHHNPTIFFGVPTLYAAMLAHPDAGPAISSKKLRACVSAGEALPEEIGNRWKKLFGVDILDGVGSTELLHIFLSNAHGNVVYGTSGVAVPGYELLLVDESGHSVADGEIGELLVKCDTAAMGYWNQRQKSRSTFQGEWTRTGDKYVKGDDGRYRYCGRTDDMFKVSGNWVSPFEVESASSPMTASRSGRGAA